MVCMTNLTSVITIHQHPSAGWFPSPRFVKKNSTPSDIRTYVIIITTTTIIILYVPISTATNWGYNGVYNGVSPVLKLYPHPKNTPLINWPSYLHICCWYKSSKVYSINIYISPILVALPHVKLSHQGTVIRQRCDHRGGDAAPLEVVTTPGLDAEEIPKW